MAFDTALDANFYQKGEGVYNAGHSDFGSSSDSDATRIQAAIDAAAADSVPMVLVPDTMLPYSGVTFNDSVRMIREGQGADVYDVKAYGAAGDGSTDDTAAIQSCINECASTHGHLHLPLGRFMFDRLFFHHDATLNPDFPSADREQGRIRISSAGFPMAVDNVRNGERFGTVLESTNTTDPCLSFLFDVSGNPYRQLRIGGFTVIQDVAGFAVNVNRLNSNGVFEDITIYNPNAAGSGLRWQNGFNINLRRLWIVARSGGSSGVGYRMDNPNVQGGGIFNLEQINVKDFDRNYVFGGGAARSAQMRQCQGIGADTAEVDFESGWSVNINACHFEGYSTRGVWVRNEAKATIDGETLFGGGASEADIDIGDPSGTDAAAKTGSATIIKTHHTGISNIGIRFTPTGNERSVTIIKPKLLGAAGTETGIQLDGAAVAGTLIVGPRFQNLGTNIGGLGSSEANVFLEGGTVQLAGGGATTLGFFGTTPAGQQSALTAADGSTVDGTYGTQERDVIQNLVARQGELEAVLQAYGLLA